MPSSVLSVSLQHCEAGITVVPIWLLNKLRLPEDVELSQHLAEWDLNQGPELCLFPKWKWRLERFG